MLLHTGGISTAGLGQIMKIVKDLRLTPETVSAKHSLYAANAKRSAMMFDHMQHCGTNVFNQSHTHVIHC
jgi:hypothetical protein